MLNCLQVCLINPNPLAILGKNLPQSAKIQHHAVSNTTTQLLDFDGLGTSDPVQSIPVRARRKLRPLE